MAHDIYTPERPKLSQLADGMFALTVVSGGEKTNIVMSRHSARSMCEIARRELDRIDREETTARVLRMQAHT